MQIITVHFHNCSLHYIDNQIRKKYLQINDENYHNTPNFIWNSPSLTPALIVNPMLRKPLDLIRDHRAKHKLNKG